MTSRPVWRTAWAEEENRRVSPKNAQMTAEPSAPAPYSSADRALQPYLAAGERGDLRVHRRDLSL